MNLLGLEEVIKTFKHERNRRLHIMRGSNRKYDETGELRHVFFGVMMDALPRGTDTPEGFYHNEPVYDSLENRYRAALGQHKLETPK